MRYYDVLTNDPAWLAELSKLSALKTELRWGIYKKKSKDYCLGAVGVAENSSSPIARFFFSQLYEVLEEHWDKIVSSEEPLLTIYQLLQQHRNYTDFRIVRYAFDIFRFLLHPKVEFHTQFSYGKGFAKQLKTPHVPVVLKQYEEDDVESDLPDPEIPDYEGE